MQRGLVSLYFTAYLFDYVVATCRIKWIPNYETEGREVVFSAMGDASPENTTDFTKWYLAAMAENRAFVRCVRNFLKINIVGSDECGDVKKGRAKEKPAKETLTDPRSQLEELMKNKGVSLDILKERLRKEEYKNAGFAEHYNNTIPGKMYDDMEISSNRISKEFYLLGFALLEFEECEYIEMLYLKAAERCTIPA